ncbi:MAG: SIS domain-containing protein [Candidatus Glassbacteria bacterium]
MSDAKSYISQYLTMLTDTLSMVNAKEVAKTIEILATAREGGGKIFICGNGGSAATASHFACDLAKGTMEYGNKPFKVIPLTDNVPLITAWANDSDYSKIFAMQLEPLVDDGDVVIGISGSGNSPNVVNAIEAGNLHGAVTIGLVGFDGGSIKRVAGHSVHVVSFNMQQVEDVHMILVHLIASALRDELLVIERQQLLSMDAEL